MALALTEEYINTFLRDHKTWNRAAMQPTPAARSPTIPTAGLYRRGSVSNVNTLHFAGALRSCDGRLQLLHSNEKQTDKVGWCKSTKRVAPEKDPLKMELRRNLRRRGYVDAREDARHVTAERARSSSAGTKRANAELHKRQVAQLTMEERAHRRKLACDEQLLRQEHAKNVLLIRLNSLLDDEFSARKDIFRTWLTSLLSLKKTEQSGFEQFMGVSPANYKRLLKVQLEEERQRQQVHRECDKQATCLSKMVLLINLEAIELEINKCHLKEMQLKQKQQL